MIALPQLHPHWPESIEHAVIELLGRLPDDDHDTIRNMAEASSGYEGNQQTDVSKR